MDGNSVVNTWFVLVESNTSGTGQLFARAARALGHRPVLLSRDPDRYPYAAKDHLDVVQVNTQDAHAVVQVCERLGQESGLAGVLSSSDYFIDTAADVARKLGLPGQDPEAVQRSRDKDSQRYHLREAGVPIPEFRVVANVVDAVDAASAIGLPVILKPVRGSGSIGVKLCETATEVAAHAELLLERTHNERGMPLPSRLLVEECVTGAEYSVEIMSGTCVGVTRKHLGPPPFQVEVGHDYPAPAHAMERHRMQAAATAACLALGLDWGAAHVELRMTAAGPSIIEVNPRLAGGFIPELIRLADDVDLVTALVSAATGNRAVTAGCGGRTASIRFVMAPGDGRLVRVDGIERARATPGVLDVTMYRESGELVTRRGDFRDRIGHVVTCHVSAEVARTAADTAHALLRPKICDGTPGNHKE